MQPSMSECGSAIIVGMSLQVPGSPSSAFTTRYLGLAPAPVGPCGMKDGIPLKYWTPGGSTTPLFTAEHIDVPLDFEGAAGAGSMLGTTAVQIFNETVSVPWAVMKWTEFYKHESCGKCTPCREGTYWLLQILERMLHKQGTPADVETLLDVCDNILGRSFCALGDGATSPITSGIKYFRQEFLDLCTAQPVVARPDQLAELTGASA